MIRFFILSALAATILTSNPAQAMSGYVKMGTIEGMATAVAQDKSQTRQQNRRVEFKPVKN